MKIKSKDIKITFELPNEVSDGTVISSDPEYGEWYILKRITEVKDRYLYEATPRHGHEIYHKVDHVLV